MTGSVVWVVAGSALVVWLAVTFVFGRRLPTIAGVVHFWLDSWAGRLVMLACWAAAGYHVLAQRP